MAFFFFVLGGKAGCWRGRGFMLAIIIQTARHCKTGISGKKVNFFATVRY